MITPVERGLVAHLIADWLLQNSWMARHKMNLRHPAGWVHAAIHGVCLGLALDWTAGVGLGIIHLLIDTRVPLDWWSRVFKKSHSVPEAGLIAILTDQSLHLVTIVAWVSWFGPGR